VVSRLDVILLASQPDDDTELLELARIDLERLGPPVLAVAFRASGAALALGRRGLWLDPGIRAAFSQALGAGSV
jgi:hypothetical protein